MRDFRQIINVQIPATVKLFGPSKAGGFPTVLIASILIHAILFRFNLSLLKSFSTN